MTSASTSTTDASAPAARLLPPIDHASRCRAVIDRLADRTDGVDTLLFTDLVDVRWLTGFTGSLAWAVVRGDGVVLGTDLRYRERATAETAGAGVEIVARQQRSDLHAELIARLGSSAGVGLDPTGSTHAEWVALAREASLVSVPSPVGALRRVKDDAEIARIEAAAAAADAALAEVEPLLLASADHPLTEADVRTELEYRMRLRGADDRSYDTIVATGPQHAARPHHEVTGRTIGAGDTVIIDVGGLVEGYHSDMTRSWVIGEATSEQHEVYDLVAASQAAGLAATTAGATAREVDDACRAVFGEAGRLDWYLHGTGHGVGLRIHEDPFLSQASTDRLEAGMVVTVEPGLYRDGFGGFRIEDLVVVAETGCRVLTHTPTRALT